jgi:hypothetical protein
MGVLTVPMRDKKDSPEMVTEFHHGVMVWVQNLA